MGIKGLMAFLKKKCPEAHGTVSLSHFRGEKIAVDAMWWVFANLTTARNGVIAKTNVLYDEPDEGEIMSEWGKLMCYFLKPLIQNNITPVFVFDGKSPVEKFETQEDRKKGANKYKDQLKAINDEIANTDPLEISPALITKKKTIMKRIVPRVSSSRKAYIRGVLEDLGIPILDAVGEGERLCSALCAEGKVAAVISTDSDTLALGCTLLLNKKNGTILEEVDGCDEKVSVTCYDYWSYPVILRDLGLSPKQFLDLCIMSGCDFNKNIYRVGIAKSYKLLQKHGSFNSIGYGEEAECINYERCVELMGHSDSKSLIEKGDMCVNRERFSLTGRDRLQRCGSEYMVTIFSQGYRDIFNKT